MNLRLVFPVFGLWTQKLALFEFKFEFYVNFPPRTGFSGLESKYQVQKWGLAYGFPLEEPAYRGGVHKLMILIREIRSFFYEQS